MISQPVPNVPWQDKPKGHTGAPVWRYSEKPYHWQKSGRRSSQNLQQCRNALW